MTIISIYDHIRDREPGRKQHLQVKPSTASRMNESAGRDQSPPGGTTSPSTKVRASGGTWYCLSCVGRCHISFSKLGKLWQPWLIRLCEGQQQPKLKNTWLSWLWTPVRRAAIGRIEVDPRSTRWTSTLPSGPGGFPTWGLVIVKTELKIYALTLARCQDPSLWTTTGWPENHSGWNSHLPSKTNAVIGSPHSLRVPLPPRLFYTNSQSW